MFWSNLKLPSWSVSTARSFNRTIARGTGAPVTAFFTTPDTVLGTAAEVAADPAPGILLEVDDRPWALSDEPPANNAAKIHPKPAIGREASRVLATTVPGDHDCGRRQSTQGRNTNKHLTLACQRVRRLPTILVREKHLRAVKHNYCLQAESAGVGLGLRASIFISIGVKEPLCAYFAARLLR